MKSAPLTSTLLARKGTAGPSQLRKVDAEAVDLRPVAPPTKSLTDISIAAGRPDAVENPESEAGRVRPVRAIAMHPTTAIRAKSDQTARVKMSLRLDRARHARLRVMATRTERNMQDIISVALDRYLDQLDKPSPTDKTTRGALLARETK